ncbi:MAG: flagellar regulator YcgR PilZN domain-containing protein [Betaproteobacteria bacterium]
MSAPASEGGMMTRSPAEIARILESLRKRDALLTMHLDAIPFQSTLREVDAAGARLLLDRCPAEAANAALLARPRCTFHADLPGWHIEFATGAAREVTVQGTALIECPLPDVLVSTQRRAEPRSESEPPPPTLSVLADAAGFMPFDAQIVDISPAGIGFLAYSPEISLEPGTVLRGCRIQIPGKLDVTADLEVRYSLPVEGPGGARVMRSGCRFISTPPEILALARQKTTKK